MQEVTAYERRIDAWLSTKFNQDHVTTQVANKSAESIAPPAVIAFEVKHIIISKYNMIFLVAFSSANRRAFGRLGRL